MAAIIFFIAAAMVSLTNTESRFSTNEPANYSEGWRITGYFTPIETDYDSGKKTEVDVVGVGKMSLDSDFVKVIFDNEVGFGEGWGKTRFGWYLGNYSDSWHKSSDPLDANNSPLRQNSIAVDNKLIPNNSIVTIPGLPGDYGKKQFIANDVGVSVHGKHIDIYTGEGKEAQREMYRVTFEDETHDLQRVCFEPPNGKP